MLNSPVRVKFFLMIWYKREAHIFFLVYLAFMHDIEEIWLFNVICSKVGSRPLTASWGLDITHITPLSPL